MKKVDAISPIATALVGGVMCIALLWPTAVVAVPGYMTCQVYDGDRVRVFFTVTPVAADSYDVDNAYDFWLVTVKKQYGDFTHAKGNCNWEMEKDDAANKMGAFVQHFEDAFGASPFGASTLHDPYVPTKQKAAGDEPAKAKTATGNNQPAPVDSQAEAFGKQLIALVRLAPTDYLDYRGSVAAENNNSTTYIAKQTYPDLHANGLWIKAQKNGGAAFYRADYTNEEAISFAQSSMLGLAAMFSRPGNNEYAGFTANAKMQKDDSGVMMASVFYKGIAVASLNINAKRDAAYLFIGLIESENLAADKAIISSIQH